MPGRIYRLPGESGGRYGFNGKEQDSEVKGEGAQYDYGFRIYDPRLGRFLSVDPLFQSYPWYTPYQFAGNTPIQAIDLDGLEEWVVTRWYDGDGNVTRIRIFTVVDKKDKKTHVNLHFKNKEKVELANGKKVLYLHLVEGTNKVFSTHTTGSALTKEEVKIFNSRKAQKKLNSDNDHYDLGPTYKSYKSGTYDNMADQFIEYNAFKQFNVPPPLDKKPSTPVAENPEPPQPPGAPVLEGFDRSDYNVKKNSTYTKNISTIVSWLVANPEYKLDIGIAGRTNKDPKMKSWNDTLVWELFSSNYTVGDRADAMIKAIRNSLSNAGVDLKRVNIHRGEVNSAKNTYTVVQ